MKRRRPLCILFIVCIVSGMLVGCGTPEPSWDSFEGALNEKSFPVPQEASSPDRTTTNVAIDYVRYSLPGLKEEDGVAEPYLEVIEAWGWEEQTNMESGNSRVFQKEGLVVHLTIHDDYFIVTIPKEKKASIKGLKSK